MPRNVILKCSDRLKGSYLVDVANVSVRSLNVRWSMLKFDLSLPREEILTGSDATAPRGSGQTSI